MSPQLPEGRVRFSLSSRYLSDRSDLRTSAMRRLDFRPASDALDTKTYLRRDTKRADRITLVEDCVVPPTQQESSWSRISAYTYMQIHV